MYALKGVEKVLVLVFYSTIYYRIGRDEWGCEDCLLCFTTKYSADLHELEHHADAPDSIAYIRDYIPETTKKMFAAGHRQR